MKTMRKKIQRLMILVITLTLAAFYAIGVFFMYRETRRLAESNLRQEADYIAAAVNISGENYLRQLDAVEADTRVTLIDQNGNVTYDTVQDQITLANHKNRPEFREAVKSGRGEDVRRSDTLGKDMFYYAEKLKDGNILRVSKPVSTASFLLLEMLPAMLIAGAALLIGAYFIAGRQAKLLVRPINAINLDQPLDNNVYEELTPLLTRIDQQNHEKEKIANMRKEFSANVSHELKTPLTSISGYAEIMKDGLVKPEDMQKFSERIYKEVTRLIALVEDIIRLSKLDEGAVGEQMEEVDLFEIAREVVQNLTPVADKQKVSVTLTGEKGVVRGIRQILQEMIYNVTDNAVKYNHPGGSVHVEVRKRKVKTGKQDVQVIVSDNGIGIPEDELDRIFERFYRVDKSRSKATGGTGLGLSIVKHGALIHHAKIDVQSEPGKGTTMTMTFPCENRKSSENATQKNIKEMTYENDN